MLPRGNASHMNKTFFEAVLDAIRTGVEKYGSARSLAAKSGVEPANISRWLSGSRKPRVEEVAPILDLLGIEILLPEERKKENSRDVCFVDAKISPAGGNQRPGIS